MAVEFGDEVDECRRCEAVLPVLVTGDLRLVLEEHGACPETTLEPVS